MYYGMLDYKAKTHYKIVCQGPDEKVVGLHLFGRASDEILQGFGVAIKMGATKADFDNCVAVSLTLTIDPSNCCGGACDNEINLLLGRRTTLFEKTSFFPSPLAQEPVRNEQNPAWIENTGFQSS